MIRAYYPWPTVWTKMIINGQEKIVKLLPEQKLQVEGKNPMSVKDFINGYPELRKVINSLFSFS
jgi:methionyl-tRNA formyltransferase